MISLRKPYFMFSAEYLFLHCICNPIRHIDVTCKPQTAAASKAAQQTI